jgi:hypothetical protein
VRAGSHLSAGLAHELRELAASDGISTDRQPVAEYDLSLGMLVRATPALRWRTSHQEPAWGRYDHLRTVPTILEDLAGPALARDGRRSGEDGPGSVRIRPPQTHDAKQEKRDGSISIQ